MPKRTLVLNSLVVLLSVVVCSSCVPSDANRHAPDIRYGGQYYPSELLLYGWPELWAKYGVDVDHVLFSSGTEGNEALIAGTIDINCGADTKTIALFNAIPDEALIIGVVERGDRYVTVVRQDSPYMSWDDLVGKTVATRFGTGAEGVLRKFYAREGYDWEDFAYVNLQVEDMIAALQRGQIEAFTAWEPTPAIAEAQGVGRTLMTYGDVALVPASIHTTKSFAYAHEDAVVRFLAAHLEKANLIREDPRRAAQMACAAAAQKGISVSLEAFEKAYARIDYTIDFDETVVQAIHETSGFLYEQGKIAVKPTLVWDRSFLDKAMQLTG